MFCFRSVANLTDSAVSRLCVQGTSGHRFSSGPVPSVSRFRPSSGAFPAFMGFIVTAFPCPSFRPKAGPFTKGRPKKFALIGIYE